MTNKLVVIINSLKVPKIKKLLLDEMKFLVPNYSCLQNPWVWGYRPQIPVLSVLCPQLNLLNPPPEKKILSASLPDLTITLCCSAITIQVYDDRISSFSGRHNRIRLYQCRIFWTLDQAVAWPITTQDNASAITVIILLEFLVPDSTEFGTVSVRKAVVAFRPLTCARIPSSESLRTD